MFYACQCYHPLGHKCWGKVESEVKITSSHLDFLFSTRGRAPRTATFQPHMWERTQSYQGLPWVSPVLVSTWAWLLGKQELWLWRSVDKDLEQLSLAVRMVYLWVWTMIYTFQIFLFDFDSSVYLLMNGFHFQSRTRGTGNGVQQSARVSQLPFAQLTLPSTSFIAMMPLLQLMSQYVCAAIN